MDYLARRRFLQAVGASMVGGLAGSPVFSALGATASTKVRFGWQPTLNGARYFIAHDEGLFAKNGVDVEQIKFLAGPTFFAAFQSGSIDVGFMGTPPASVGIAQGVPMKIFAVENYAYGSEGLIVSAKSGINSLKD